MSKVYIASVGLVILNDEPGAGKIPLIKGLPHPKLSGYIKTVVGSPWSVSVS